MIVIELSIIIVLSVAVFKLDRDLVLLKEGKAVTSPYDPDDVILITNTPTPTIYPTSRPQVVSPSGCVPIPHEGSISFPVGTDTKDAITTVHNTLPNFPGMRYFYLENATISANINTSYLDYGCKNDLNDFDYLNISGSFKSGNDEIFFIQGFWGKGGLCPIPIDLKFMGRDVTVCATQDEQMGLGENMYDVYLIGPNPNKAVDDFTLDYELQVSIKGYYSSNQIQEILDRIIEQ